MCVRYQRRITICRRVCEMQKGGHVYIMEMCNTKTKSVCNAR